MHGVRADHSGRKPIALLIPVLNRQAKLDRALRSLVHESGLLKVVVVDDGSDPPMRIDDQLPLDVDLIRLDHRQGIGRAINAGLRYAFEHQHQFIARLDSDDVAIEGRFRRQLEFLEAHPSVGVCGGGFHVCDPDGRRTATVTQPRSDAAIRRAMHLTTALWSPTVMIRTSVARQVGFFDPTLTCEDVDYFLRIMDVSEAANLPEPLICYECGADDSLTGTAARRRRLASDVLRLKWRRREPLNPLWWLGVLAATAYYFGLTGHLAWLREAAIRFLDGRGR